MIAETRATTPVATRAPIGPWLATLESGSSEPLRLSAVGVAPAYARVGSLSALFDGVLYNREALALELNVVDPNPAALLLAAYRRWGDRAMAQLKGIFALAVWDDAAGTLLLARDRVGVYPLFYLCENKKLSFSTSLEGWQRLAGRDLPLNRELLVGYLARHRAPLEATFYRGAKRVPPGHALELRGGGLRTWRYWRPPAPGAGAPWVTEDEIGTFGVLLEQAVARALAHGRAGIYLSGGLDSVSVAAVAVEQSRAAGQETPWALSLAFPGDVSEVAVQRGVAETLGLPQLLLPFEDAVGEPGLIGAALELCATWPVPLQNVWLSAYQRLGREGAARGCEVILTGGGGDEWLTVTPLIAADLIKGLRPAELLRYAQALQRSLKLPTHALWRNVLITNGALPVLHDAYRYLYRRFAPGRWLAKHRAAIDTHLATLPAWLAPEADLRTVLEADAAAKVLGGAMRSGPGPGGYYYRTMLESLDHTLFALDIEEIFESSRRLGMFEYNIYWDADLIEFLYRVPPELLNRGGRSKGLVRHELARRFPNLGFDRQKKLTSVDFFRSTLLREGERAWRELGGALALGDLGIVEPKALGHHVERIFADGDGRQVDLLWHILSLETWVRPRL